MSDSGWNTIDSDAGVFSELVEKLQVQDVEINDLYSIDSDSLKALDPVHGVIFLFKYGKVDRESAKNGNSPLAGEYDTEYQDKGIFFANQTIQNACATQAVLNVLFNKEEIDVGPELSNFKAFVTGFDSEMIGETISNSDLIRSVHNSFSSPNSLIIDDDKKPPADYDDKEDGLFHFIGYLRSNGHIYELDGLKSYPIKHVPVESDEDFYEKLPLVLQERMGKYDLSELRFSLLGITNNKLKQYKDTNNIEGIDRELSKREAWKRENELRRHDNLGLLVELIKSISKDSTDEEWKELLNQARKKSQLSLIQRFTKQRGL